MNEQFYNWLGQRIEDYEAARERGIKAYRTRCAKIAADLNHDVEPTVSSAGLHAPFDGYQWETEYRSGEYLKGQFLPWPEPEDWEGIKSGSFTGETKITNVPVGRADTFIKHFDALPQAQKLIKVSRGAEYKKDSDTFCYVYISKCPKDLIEAINDYLMGDIYKLQRLAKQATEQERADRDAAHAEGENAPEGRVVITGTLLSMRRQDGYYGETIKMLVQDDRGFRVWGTVPSNLDANRNDRIQFTAAVTQSDKDAKFGFFKRPTKASVIASAAKAA